MCKLAITYGAQKLLLISVYRQNCGFKVVGANDSDSESMEIIESGLKPREKLDEELLLSCSPIFTQHLKVFKTLENVGKTRKIEYMLSLDSGDDKISRLIPNYVEGCSNG